MRAYFKIEYILIFIAVLIFSSTIVLKKSATTEFTKLNSEISYIQLKHENTINLEDAFLPFTYFNQDIEEKLCGIMKLLEKEDDESAQNQLIDSAIAFQMSINDIEQKLRFGYDCLLYCSLFLAMIGVFVILSKNFAFKTEINRQEAMNQAKISLSRDLHDGVAQDLAAIKVYLQKNDTERIRFYANQAFKEVRYLIDSFHLDLNENFDLILEKTITSFGNNYEIETQFLCASSNINLLGQEKQIEIMKILHEALSNIARHSNASLVVLKITDVGNSIKFILSDNGDGFSVEEINADGKTHYGITNIKERVSALGGVVDYIINEGTTIAIDFKNIVHR